MSSRQKEIEKEVEPSGGCPGQSAPAAFRPHPGTPLSQVKGKVGPAEVRPEWRHAGFTSAKQAGCPQAALSSSCGQARPTSGTRTPPSRLQPHVARLQPMCANAAVCRLPEALVVPPALRPRGHRTVFDTGSSLLHERDARGPQQRHLDQEVAVEARDVERGGRHVAARPPEHAARLRPDARGAPRDERGGGAGDGGH